LFAGLLAALPAADKKGKETTAKAAVPVAPQDRH
jgi:hypothetical protein